ncbi:MAG: hypothetical protein QOI13_1856 [Paraburkholderia sp.]|nr:hypothetical protein [Paraburkholderia sp.]
MHRPADWGAIEATKSGSASIIYAYSPMFRSMLSTHGVKS